MMTPGTIYTLSFPVTDALTALTVGSGTLPVLATPVLAARLEECAWRAAAPSLPEGSSTVGTRLELRHLSPTPVGMQVTCRAEITNVNDRIITFSLSASDAAGAVAEGSHERVVIQNERFLSKAENKAKL